MLAHPAGFVGQVAWYVIINLITLFAGISYLASRSPMGTYLLTKLNRGVKLWTEVRYFDEMVSEYLRLTRYAGRCMQTDNRS